MTNDNKNLDWVMLDKFPKYEINRSGQVRKVSDKILLKECATNSNKRKYNMVNKDGKNVTPYIERLVAEQFIPNPRGYEIINHKDGNNLNCNVENLEWIEAPVNELYVDLVEKQGKNIKKEYFEDWETIKEFPESNYEINRMGQIRNRKTKTILQYQVQQNGYKTYTLYVDGKMFSRRAHILVAKQFIDNPEGKPVVNHKDEDKLNACVDNLEWVSYEENSNYGTSKHRIADINGVPIDEYSLEGKYIRTWKSSKAVQRYLENNYKYNDISDVKVGKTIAIIAKYNNENVEKKIFLNCVFLYSDYNKSNKQFECLPYAPRKFKEIELGNKVVVDNYYLYSESEANETYISTIKAFTKKYSLNSNQRKAINYAVECMELAEELRPLLTKGNEIAKKYTKKF